MTEHHRLRAANPVPQHEVDALSLDGADTILLEEIMADPERTARRRWLPAAAAAAVAVIGGGAVWVGSGPGASPSPSPAPGFADDPSSSVSEPPTSAEPTGPTGDTTMRLVTCEEGWNIEVAEGEAVDYACLEASADPDPEAHYQRPLRPFLLTAPGWTIETVEGTTVHWRGPDGEELYADWVVTANPQDPFAYDRYDRPGEAIDLEGVTTRLTGFTDGDLEYQVALTAAVPEQRFDDDASLVLETHELGPAEFRTVVESLRFVTLEEFEDAVGR